VASRSQGRAFGVCGGGETVEVLEKLKIMAEIDLVSTGGGAMLEFLEGKKLPGLKKILIKNSWLFLVLLSLPTVWAWQTI